MGWINQKDEDALTADQVRTLSLMNAAAKLAFACEDLRKWLRDEGGSEDVEDAPRWIVDGYRDISRAGFDPDWIIIGYLDVLDEARREFQKHFDDEVDELTEAEMQASSDWEMYGFLRWCPTHDELKAKYPIVGR